MRREDKQRTRRNNRGVNKDRGRKRKMGKVWKQDGVTEEGNESKSVEIISNNRQINKETGREDRS